MELIFLPVIAAEDATWGGNYNARPPAVQLWASSNAQVINSARNRINIISYDSLNLGLGSFAAYICGLALYTNFI